MFSFVLFCFVFILFFFYFILFCFVLFCFFFLICFFFKNNLWFSPKNVARIQYDKLPSGPPSNISVSNDASKIDDKDVDYGKMDTATGNFSKIEKYRIFPGK